MAADGFRVESDSPGDMHVPAEAIANRARELGERSRRNVAPLVPRRGQGPAAWAAKEA